MFLKTHDLLFLFIIILFIFLITKIININDSYSHIYRMECPENIEDIECENIEKLGDLQFQNGPTIAYKTNRLVIFDAKLFHKANQNLTDHYRHTIAWKTST